MMDLGADAVLYDIGAKTPLFCFDERHHHEKPNFNFKDKAKNYQNLREYIKTWGNDKAIAMEQTGDIYNQHMDLAQPVMIGPGTFPEMYMYTFPEIKLTNRNMALDQNNYINNINHTFVYGLAFDMSIFRCNGTLSDIPEYTEYMSQVIALRNQHTKYLLHGTFIDTNGGSTENKNIIIKTYRAADGGVAATVWNTSKTKQEFQIKTNKGKLIDVSLDADSVAVYVLL